VMILQVDKTNVPSSAGYFKCGLFNQLVIWLTSSEKL
jgi:hypothetical protein